MSLLLLCHFYADSSGKIAATIENQTSVTRNALQDWQRLRDYRGIFDCPAIFNGDKDAIETARKYVQCNPRHVIPDTEFLELTRNCSSFKTERGYTKNPVSQEELEFPLAFSILFHKDLEQVEYLLKTIYRPQNWYCLHLDADAPQVQLIVFSIFKQRKWSLGWIHKPVQNVCQPSQRTPTL